MTKLLTKCQDSLDQDFLTLNDARTIIEQMLKNRYGLKQYSDAKQKYTDDIQANRILLRKDNTDSINASNNNQNLSQVDDIIKVTEQVSPKNMVENNYTKREGEQADESEEVSECPEEISSQNDVSSKVV